MKNNVAWLMALVFVTIFVSVASAGYTYPDHDSPEVKIEGNNNLVVYAPPAKPKILKEYRGIFDSSLEVNELQHLDTNKLVDLIEGKIQEYVPGNGYYSETIKKMKEVYFWHFPIEAEWSVEKWKLVLNEEKKISAVGVSMTDEINALWIFEFFWRCMPIGLLILMGCISKIKRLSIFYVGMLFIAITGAYLGTKSFEYSVISLLIGVFGGGFMGALTGVLPNDEFDGRLGGFLIGGFSGFSMGGVSGVCVNQMGWKNAAINDFLIVLFFICFFSYCMRLLWERIPTLKKY